MALPVDVMDLVKSGSQIEKEREKPVRIAVFVDIDAPDALVDRAQAALHPFTATASVHVEVAEEGTKLVVGPTVDAVVGLVGSGSASLADSLAGARERAIPTVAVSLAEDSGRVAELLRHPYRDTIADPDEARAIDIELGEWLVERCQSKRLALAHNFGFMRRAVAVEHVKATAFQNAVIGVVALIPGADMPIMTANQAKMVLQIAAAYGERLGAQRAKELLGVVGGGFLFRSIARQAVAFVPGFGWVIKGGIGYTGTVAMGYAAIKYFENGADLGDLEDRLKAYGETVTAKLKGMSRREAKQLAATNATALPASPSATSSAPAEETPAGG